MLKFHKFTHATNGNEVYIAENLVFAWYPQGKTIHIVANGGASVPVSESPEVVKTALQGEKDDNKSNR